MKPGAFERLMERLARACRDLPAPEPSPGFEKNVMRELRRRAAEAAQPAWELFQPLVLRFAAAASLVAVLLVVYAAARDLFPDYEVAEVMMEVNRVETVRYLDPAP